MYIDILQQLIRRERNYWKRNTNSVNECARGRDRQREVEREREREKLD